MIDDLLEAEEIEVVETEFRGNLKGLYSDGVIFIDKTLSEKERTCVLAEELGHYFTSYGDIVDLDDVKCVKQEILARRWAYESLLPIERIVDGIKKGHQCGYDLADFLNVTEKFLQDCIFYYKCKYGITFVIDDQGINFDNLRVRR